MEKTFSSYPEAPFGLDPSRHRQHPLSLCQSSSNKNEWPFGRESMSPGKGLERGAGVRAVTRVRHTSMPTPPRAPLLCSPTSAAPTELTLRTTPRTVCTRQGTQRKDPATQHASLAFLRTVLAAHGIILLRGKQTGWGRLTGPETPE